MPRVLLVRGDALGLREDGCGAIADLLMVADGGQSVRGAGKDSQWAGQRRHIYRISGEARGGQGKEGSKTITMVTTRSIMELEGRMEKGRTGEGWSKVGTPPGGENGDENSRLTEYRF